MTSFGLCRESNYIAHMYTHDTLPICGATQAEQQQHRQRLLCWQGWMVVGQSGMHLKVYLRQQGP